MPKILNPLLNSKLTVLLLLTLLVASLSRIYKLNSIPSILSEKEALMGYSSYSILETGKDLTAKFPLFEIDSSKEKLFSLYSFLSLPSIIFFNLDHSSVRLPSAIMGTLQVFLLFFFTKEIFKKTSPNQATKIASLSALFLAISPWNVFYSRLVSPENLSLTFFLAALYFLIRGQSNIISSIFLTISMFSWDGSLVLTPLLIITYFLLVPESKTKKRFIVLLIAIEAICLIFTKQFDIVFKNTLLAGADQLNLPKKILTNFLDYFSADFLFFKGDYRIKFWLRDLGIIYLFFLPFLIAGILSIFQERGKITKFFLLWPVFCFAYAALGVNMRDVQKSLWASIPLQTIMATGFLTVFQKIKKSPNKILKILFSSFIFACFYNILLFFHFYLVHFPQKGANEPEYALHKSGIFLAQNYQNYQKILIDYKYGNFYLYTLFYMNYPPKLYQVSVQKPDYFGKFEFIRTKKEDLNLPKTLYIFDFDKEKQTLPKEVGMKKIADFSTLNGDSILTAWELK